MWLLAMVSAMTSMSRNAVQDILNRFHGSWLVTPETDANGQVVGCTAVLEQDVLPRGEDMCCNRHVYNYMCHGTTSTSSSRRRLLHSYHVLTSLLQTCKASYH